ncbi:caspase domain-containing protein [Mycena amicta]|nr:caspase domain-containing protein [Mycena amicta]
MSTRGDHTPPTRQSQEPATAQSRHRKLELQIASIRYPRRTLPSLFSKVLLAIHSASDVSETADTRIVTPPGSGETFTFDSTSDELHLSLYRKAPFAKSVLLGTVSVISDIEPREKDIVKTLTSATGKRVPPIEVTYQLRERAASDANAMSTDFERCPIFLLVIGIDEYKSRDIPNLHGCVNDARTIKDYLTNRFRIPEDQVAFLTNAGATRTAIISRFQSHLIYNASIAKDDTVIIYYAGHGSKAPAPESWPSSEGKVKTLVPYDERDKDANGQPIHGIPDRTMDRLVGRLASEKGDNITLIFDCCHSDGTPTTPIPSISARRSVETHIPLPENLDRYLFGRTLDEDTLPSIIHPYTRSHVLLAACHQQQPEHAHEILSAGGSPRGFFTDALIRRLRAMGPPDAGRVRVTYQELVKSLGTLPNQHPQCLGKHKDWYIFENEGPVFLGGLRTYEVLDVPSDSVASGDEREQDAVLASLVFVAVAVGLSSSILKLLQAELEEDTLVGVFLPSGTRLVVHNPDNEAPMIKVFIDENDDDELSALTPADLTIVRSLPGFIVAGSFALADIVIRRTSDQQFSLSRREPTLVSCGLQDVMVSLPLESLPHTLDAVAAFHHHLRLAPPHRDSPLRGKVTLEMYKLVGDYGSRVPDTDVGNLLDGGNDGVGTRLLFDANAKYGFSICNYSKLELFPYLFYFDPTSYSVDAWYLPECYRMQSPLPAATVTEDSDGSDVEPSRITVGYSAGGGYAFQFLLPDGVTADAGFLKLFISTKYLDLRNIEQPGIAIVDREAGAVSEQTKPWVTVEANVWDALQVPLTIFMEERERD